jgi:hypothetical protein
MVDLDQEGSEVLYVFDEKDFKPHPVRFSSVLLNPDSYIVSVARMKTHDRAIATLSLKNNVFGTPEKDKGFGFGKDRKEGTKRDKPIVHGSGYSTEWLSADRVAVELMGIDFANIGFLKITPRFSPVKC